jgi:hypothetical protein
MKVNGGDSHFCGETKETKEKISRLAEIPN